MIRSTSDQAMEDVGDVLLNYVSNRIWENVAGDIVAINEIFESNYFTLNKHMFSNSLKVYLHFKSGEQAYSIGKKYSEIAQQIDHRWLDVIKAAIELDISLSIEENLLKFLSKLESSEIFYTPTNSEFEFMDPRNADRGLVESDRILSIQYSGNDDLSPEREVQNRLLSLSNTETVVQHFEDFEEDVKRKTEMKSINFCYSCNKEVSPVPFKEGFTFDLEERFKTCPSNNRKSHVFTSSQLLLRSANILSVNSSFLHGDHTSEDACETPILLFPFFQSPDSHFMQMGLAESNGSTNSPYHGFQTHEGKSSLSCLDDIDERLENKIIFVLPDTNVSELQSDIKIQFNDPMLQARFVSSHVCHHIIESSIQKPSFSVNLNIQCTLNLFYTLRSLQDLVPGAATLFSTDSDYFIPEKQVILSREPLLCQSNKDFVLNDNIKFLVPSCSKYLCLSSSFLTCNLGQSEQVNTRIDDSLKMLSDLSETDCSVSLCPKSQRGRLNLQCLVIHNSRDIGYLSYFRSLPWHTQRDILKNCHELPCSKDFSIFPTSIEKFQYTSTAYGSYSDSLRTSSSTIINHQESPRHKITTSEPTVFSSKNLRFRKDYFCDLAKHSSREAEDVSPLGMWFRDSLTSYIRNIIRTSYFHIKMTRYIKKSTRHSQWNLEGKERTQTLKVGEIVFPQKDEKQISPVIQTICTEGDCRNKKKLMPKAITAMARFKNEVVPVLKRSCDIKEEMRCLNLMIYFLEELFDVWAQEMVSVADAEEILHRLFEQLKPILIRIAEKRSVGKLSDICDSCVEDIDTSLTCYFDPIYILALLRSILHKLNLFGKYISFIHLIPTSLKYSLYKLFLHYKRELSKQNQKKLRCCEIEITAKPEVLNSLFSSTGSDRRIKFIENKSKSRIQLQPAKNPFEQKRLVKVYQVSQERGLNVTGLISMISKAVNNSEDKIHLSSNGKFSEEYDSRYQRALSVLGEVKWAAFKYI